MKNFKLKILFPLILAVVAVAAYQVGMYSVRAKQTVVDQISSVQNPMPMTYSDDAGYVKLAEVMRLVSETYVDTVNMTDLVEQSLPTILSNLDPHSSYIPAKDLDLTNESLADKFFGVGIQFNIQEDTIHVVSVISGGPAQKVGILPGDKIVTIDDSLFVGKICTNETVIKRLRGSKETKVKVGVKRQSSKDILPFEIVRGEIPLETIDTHYMIDNKTGYIRVDRFGESTDKEFLACLENLHNEGVKQLIVDLRGNGGGFLNVVKNMLDNLLSKNDLILITRGTKIREKRYNANGNKKYCNLPIVVLVDEHSASASEIFAGAIQDNDRGLIVGRRSFGKGLVQQQYPLLDNSAIRVTIARYYTPSGRCIQKPYGDGKDYEKDLLDRYEKGEIFDEDSMRASIKDSVEYKTLKLGRTIYAGGGIAPDIFVSRDTVNNSPYYIQAFNKGLIYSFALKYSEDNRELLLKQGDYKKLYKYLVTNNIVDKFVDYASAKGLERKDKEINISRSKMEMSLCAYIVRNVIGKDDHGDRPFYWILNKSDKEILQAIKAFDSKEMKEITESL